MYKQNNNKKACIKVERNGEYDEFEHKRCLTAILDIQLMNNYKSII